VNRYISRARAPEIITVLSDKVSKLALKQRRNAADCINADFQGNFEDRRLSRHIVVDHTNIANAVSAYVNGIAGVRVSRFESAARICQQLVAHNVITVNVEGVDPFETILGSAWLGWALAIPELHLNAGKMPAERQTGVSQLIARSHHSTDALVSLFRLVHESYGSNSVIWLRKLLLRH
jgi:hypothetical protein